MTKRKLVYIFFLLNCWMDMAIALSNATTGITKPEMTGIVYVRVPRTIEKIDVHLPDGTSYTISSPDIWDRLPDTQLIDRGFNAPGQLVYRSANGSERIIYDCFTEPTPCVPLDPFISPDGKKVLFSVYRGTKLGNVVTNRSVLPNRILSGKTEAQLHVAEIDTGIVTPLAHKAGDHDISPSWLPDGKIIFSSDRSNIIKPHLNQINPQPPYVYQLYSADQNGQNAINISPHELAGAIHPYVLKDGRVAYSSHWLNHNLAYYKNNGGINWPATLDNMWAIESINYQGGDMVALLGAHRDMFLGSDKRYKTLKSLHFIGQRENQDICTSNYYRGNNLGLGDILCWTPETQGVEGQLPHFFPRNLYAVANWTQSEDRPSQELNGIFQGKIGYPEGLSNNQLMLTLGRGYCTQVMGNIKKAQSAVINQPDQLGCDTGIYVTSQIPSKSMTDLIKVVDEPIWHEFSAKSVRPRPVTSPAASTANHKTCVLASSDAGTAETGPHKAYKFNNNFFTSANNGSEISSIPHDKMKGIRFWKVEPNRKGDQKFVNSIGNKVSLLGDVELLADHSFSVELPCDTPYIMAGIDEQGRVIKRDQLPQSLRTGETRVCTGCHLHSRPGRPYEASLAYTSEPVKLTTPHPVPSYEQDIKPLFVKHCSTCHADDIPLFDYKKLVWDYFQAFVPDSKKIKLNSTTNPRRNYGLQRPYTSKYVNNMYALESLLYWKAANQRTDGRTDATYKNDIDFGLDHPTDLSIEELKLIGDWLDSGATQ